MLRRMRLLAAVLVVSVLPLAPGTSTLAAPQPTLKDVPALAATQDAPSCSSFRIDPVTGHVVASRLRSADSSARYDDRSVTYAPDPGTGRWVLATMSDKSTDSEDTREIEGNGTFRNWRVVPQTARRACERAAGSARWDH